MTSRFGKISVVSGRSNPPLAEAAAKAAGVGLTTCNIVQFSDGELMVEVGENIRGNDVFVIQSTSTPVNDHIMELLLILDALKRASAGRITAVIPYFGYARQDRKTRPRVPITAKLVADLIVAAGAARVLTMDLHAGQIMGFFDIPVDNLYAIPVLMKYLKEQYSNRPLAIVSPDVGGAARAREFARRIPGASLAVVDKRRSGPNEVAEMQVVGDVRGKMAIVVDDMIDTGGTIVRASEALLENGASEVVACATHGVLSGGALERIIQSRISRLIISDSVYHPGGLVSGLGSGREKVIRLSVASLIGDAIKRTHEEESISSLFEVD